MGHEWCYRNQTGNMGKRVENEQIGWATQKKESKCMYNVCAILSLDNCMQYACV